MKKGKIFTVIDSSNGNEKERRFLFIPASTSSDESNNNEPVCKTQCPYGVDRCSRMPDPRDPENSDRCFQDYCFDLSEESDSFADYIPVKGTIEEGMRDVNLFKPIIDRGSLVDIREVIHTMCKDVCDRYKEDLGGCTPNNQFCILHDILAKRDINMDSIESQDEDGGGKE
jgi:hypothetical protein